MKSISKLKVSYAPSSAIEAEIDIDVKPMMNILLILIPFLVSVAVYTRLSIIELSLPPNITSVATSAGNEKPKLRLTLVIAQDYCSITYGETLLDSIPYKNGAFPVPRIKQLLEQHRLTAEIQDEAVVAPHDGIRFDSVVKCMDICTSAGFTKVSLASASGS